MSLNRVYRVLHKQALPYSVLLETRQTEEAVLLESGTVINLTSSEKDEIKSDYSKATDAYGCLGIIKFRDDTLGKSCSLYLVLVTACMPVGKLLNSDIFRITGVSFFSLQNGSLDNDHRCSDVKKLLSSGKFYFSWTPQGRSDDIILDLTISLQKHKETNVEDNRFFWNHLLHLHFRHFGINCSDWLFKVMCGGIDIRTVYVGAQQAKAAIISRLSCERAGTRFNVRGVNDEGNVANFVESEQAIVIGSNISSFMQIRGSIPLFWEQPGLNVGSHKVKMSRGVEASAPAFDKHFRKIVDTYGQCVNVNLLGSKEGEKFLSRLYQNHHSVSDFKDSIPMVCFDFHAECRSGRAENLPKLKTRVQKHIEDFGSYSYRADKNVRITQSGVFRVNCLDCLDRTNSTQTYFGLQMVSKQLKDLGLEDTKQLEDRFTEAFKAAWPVTGDLISRMYAGTGALEGKTKIRDGARSMSRAIQNNFLDQNKQNAIDLLIQGTNTLDAQLSARANNLLSGECLWAPTNVLRGMCDKYNEYSSPMPIRMGIGTWNVNGGKHFRSIAYKDQTLDNWLLNAHKQSSASSENLYQALFDFEGVEEDDLPFAEGDIITVTGELDGSDWMSGSFNGHSGIFPSAYVKKMLPKYVALFDFPAHQEGDLDFKAGDIIEVEEMTGEWWKGRVVREGLEEEGIGSFPANFVEMYRDGSKEATPTVNEGSQLIDWNKGVDIYAIGFQEMVELNAGNIVNTSHSNQQAWGIELQKTISSNYKYILLASEQLVGVCLYVFVRPHHASHIRDVEIVTVKTGMGGATGNKGAVGIRMQFYNSSLCFVCSHLAAGQSQVQERNNDYSEICKKMVFSSSKSIFCHDYVFWSGDLNYRIDLPIEKVKELVNSKSWDTLKQSDQLYIERKEGKAFRGFIEGETDFAPTYKYDLFSEDYDTSDKSRTPAWTDRVQWYKKQWFGNTGEKDCDSGNLLFYGRAELKTSDHRPVIALLDVDVLQCNEEHLNDVFHKVVSSQGPPDASILVSAEEGSVDWDIPSSGESFDKLLMKFKEVGDVILTRQLQGNLLIIFTEGWMALKALTLSGSTVDGKSITVILKAKGWEAEVEHEIRPHSMSFTGSHFHNEESFADHDQTFDYNYDYPGEEEDDEYEKGIISSDPYDQHSYPVDALAENGNEISVMSSNDSYEPVNDPGWACEDENYYVAPTLPPKPQPPKIAPPRPSSAPTKKPAPPRPNTLPSVAAGPPAVPAYSPSMTPGPPSTIPEPTKRIFSTLSPSVLIPEPAPKANQIPKVKPRNATPKRKAPAPPPAVQRRQNTPLPKPKGSAPPLPFNPPKGSTAKQEKNNVAFLESPTTPVSLLDIPLSSTASLLDQPIAHNVMMSSAPIIPVRQSLNNPAVKSVFAEQINRTNSTNTSDLFDTSVFSMPAAVPRTQQTLTSKHSSAPVLFHPNPLFPSTVVPPPMTNINSQFSGNSQMPIRSMNPQYKPMAARTVSVPAAVAMQRNSLNNILTPSTVPLKPTAVPLKPTPAYFPDANGNKPAFDLSNFMSVSSNSHPPPNYSTQSAGKTSFSSTASNDPWLTLGVPNKNANAVPNSFSTDFAKYSFNSSK